MNDLFILREKIDKFNSITNSYSHLEMEVTSLSKKEEKKLTIIGSEDLCYYHNFAIEVNSCCYYSGPLEWSSTPQKANLIELIEAHSSTWLELKNRLSFLEPGHLLKFSNDDSLIIICSSGELNIDLTTTYYYKRDNIKSNEKIADWVK